MNSAKPHFVVFYAWQSDRPSSRNRYLIEEAAADAAHRINRDKDLFYEVNIDQDARGVPGLCDIPATILEKINSADAFLCDLTYVAVSEPEECDDDEFKVRYCSNPNVLFELGYAFRVLGPERIVCLINETYGPKANQIFDLAHRRFPIGYRFPEDGKTKRQVQEELSGKWQCAIESVLALGSRIALGIESRFSVIRNKFESQVRDGEFRELQRGAGAIGITVVPMGGQKYDHAVIRRQHVPPPGERSGWNPEIRGRSVLSISDVQGARCRIAELRNDGVVLGAESWVLDPAFHPTKKLIIPSSAMEVTVVEAVTAYARVLRELEAPLPWTIGVSLLEVKDYWLLISNSEVSKHTYPGIDLVADPIVVRTLTDIADQRKVGRILKPAFDFIWREFGFAGSCIDQGYWESFE